MALSELRQYYQDRPAMPITATVPAQAQWRRGTVTISCAQPEGERHTISAYRREGLAVHRAYMSQGWTITHAESGLCFDATFATCREAKAKADELLMLEGMWDQPLEAFAKGLTPTIVTRINTILGTHYRPYRVSTGMDRELARRKARHVSRASIRH